MRDPARRAGGATWAGPFSRADAGVSHARRWPSVAVAVEADAAAPAPVHYGWDVDTEILSACVADPRGGGWPSAVLTLEAPGGGWVTLDLRGGRLCGVEVAVWPPLRRRAALRPPPPAVTGHARCPVAPGTGEVAVDVELVAERDAAGRTVRLGIGPARPARVARVGRDMLVEVDDAGTLAGVWLLAIPPLPPVA